MKIWQMLTGKSYRAESQATIAELKEENAHLRSQALWITKAQERSVNSDRRKGDYMETAPQALELLRNEAFKTAYSDMVVDIQRQILNSTPEQTEVRETCYLESQVLQKLAIKLSYQFKVAKGVQLKAV
tara:strand:- start:3453 stop:3839 length:387 start_codon:yes stop_codon:yes gene_type:complete